MQQVLPKYCTHCGKPLNIESKEVIQKGYNTYTGEPEFVLRYVLVCEKFIKYRVFSDPADSQLHDYLEVDEPHDPTR